MFVVCGCSIRVRGYLAVSYVLGFRIMCRGIIRYMPWSVELPPRGAVDDDNDTARIYVSGAAGDNQVRLTSCVWFIWYGL